MRRVTVSVEVGAGSQPLRRCCRTRQGLRSCEPFRVSPRAALGRQLEEGATWRLGQPPCARVSGTELSPVSPACSRPVLPPASQLPGGRGGVPRAAAAALLCAVWQQGARRAGGLSGLLQHLLVLCPRGRQLWTSHGTAQVVHKEEQEGREGEGERG